MYLALKHLHLSLITLSFLLFLMRSYWLFTQSSWLKHKIIKVLPHPINLLMILSGFAVAHSLGIPTSTPWLTTKLIGLVIYVVLGVLAFKQTSKGRQIVFFSAAVIAFVYICSVAVTKLPGVFVEL